VRSSGGPGWALLAVPALAGCAYVGSARGFDPAEFDRDPAWVAVRGILPVLQEGESDCGAAVLATVLRYWGVPTDRREVFEGCGSPAGGIRAEDLRAFVRGKGLQARLFEGTFEDLERELSKRRPVLVGTVKPHVTFVRTHYELVVGLHRGDRRVVTLDPAEGWRQNTWDGFLEEWRPARCLMMAVYRLEGPAAPPRG